MDDNKWIVENEEGEVIWISREEYRIPSPSVLEPGMIVKVSPRIKEFLNEQIYDPEDNVVVKIQEVLKKWKKDMNLWIDPKKEKYSGKTAVVLRRNRINNNNNVYLSIDQGECSWDYKLLEYLPDDEWNELSGNGYEGKAQALIQQQIPPKFKEITDHVVVNPIKLNTYTILYGSTRYEFKYGGSYYYDLLCDNYKKGIVERVKECDLELYEPYTIPEFHIGDLVININNPDIGKGGSGIVKKVTHILIDNREEVEYVIEWPLTGNISVNVTANSLIPDPDRDIFEEFCNHRCKMCCPGNNKCPIFIYKRKEDHGK